MRSELIFKALKQESNRYLLCRVIAKGTRKLHRPNTRIPDTTNEMLEYFSIGPGIGEAKVSERVKDKEQREQQAA